MERKHVYDFAGWQADLLGLTREQYIAYYHANQIGLGIDESVETDLDEEESEDSED